MLVGGSYRTSRNDGTLDVGDLDLHGNLFDKNNSKGSAGQVLLSDGGVTGAYWSSSIPTVSGVTGSFTSLNVTGNSFIGGSQKVGVSATSSTPYAVTPSDFFVEADSGSAVYNLPAVVAADLGRVLQLKNTMPGSSLTIHPSGTDVIDGQNLDVTLQTWDTLNLICSAAGEWEITSGRNVASLMVPDYIAGKTYIPAGYSLPFYGTAVTINTNDEYVVNGTLRII